MPAGTNPARPRKPRGGPKANRARGEHVVELAGKSYRLRPSYEANVAIEEALDTSLLDLLRRANACALRLSELGVIYGEYIRAGADEADRLTRAIADERVAELIYEDGVSGFYPALTLVLVDAVSGGRSASGEPKAVTTTGT